ncbi:MAG TPA: sensor histidine kinase KdpD [Bacteroidota bacterium]|nr:sensor histidine kinase KdpD [Bacteroidota bacterium]
MTIFELMDTPEEYRPNPDELLNALKKEEEHSKRGKLKIFFGMCAGAGKTYDMLKSAHEAKAKGIDVMVGYVETHKRKETDALLEDLAILPRNKIEYRGVFLEEMNLDAILERKPQLVLVDELAHTNVQGSRHTKRYQDVLEILDNGIDVYTTLNVQHLESRAEAVAQITGSIVRETVPDSIFEQADEVELIDISPEELLKRLAEGKVYAPERSQQAVQNFFRKGNLTALREMSLRLTAERVDQQLREYKQTQHITGTWKSSQRLLVGISASPSAISVIRWARRMAYAMNATWIAAYVESSKQLSDAAKKQLNSNMKLARELGAEVMTTGNEHVPNGLVHIAQQQNVSHILIGRSKQYRMFANTLYDRLIELSGDIDVTVVGDHSSEHVQTKNHVRLFEIQSGWSQYAVVTLIVMLVAVASYPLTVYAGYQTVSLILLLTVALLSLRFGVGPVLLAAAVSSMIWNYFFIPPRFTLTINKPQDMLMFVTYFAIAAVTGTLTARVRAREKAVHSREERATALFTLTKQLTAAKTQNEVAEAAGKNIASYLNSEVAIFLSEPDGDIFTKAHTASTFKIDEKEFGVAAWVYWNEKKAGKYTDTLPSANAVYYPISGPRYPLGVIGVKPRDGKQFTMDQESLLENFIAQIAATLEREQLNEMAKRTIVYAESEKLYKTLFNSISHELRTPITAIMNASEGLLFNQQSSSDELHSDLLLDIHTAAERLNRLVENLLDMTRLESGQLALKSDWCDVRDIINTSLNKLEKELSHHKIQIRIPEGLPLVKLDYVLIEQVITNLLYNASLYTPHGSTIDIETHIDHHELMITISDDGPGFPPDTVQKLFDKFYRVPGTRTGGTGLGLSIARGFVEAHKGTITVANKSTGGAQFTITLPAEPQPSVIVQ